MNSLILSWKGDEILKMITTETEDLNINMVWEVIDWYRNAVLLIRERDLELEAIALSSLGRVYAKVKWECCCLVVAINLNSQAHHKIHQVSNR